MSDFVATGNNVNLTATNGQVLLRYNTETPTFLLDDKEVFGKDSSFLMASPFGYYRIAELPTVGSGTIFCQVQSVPATGIMLHYNNVEHDSTTNSSDRLSLKAIGFNGNRNEDLKALRVLAGTSTTKTILVDVELNSGILGPVNVISSKRDTFDNLSSANVSGFANDTGIPSGYTAIKTISAGQVNGIFYYEKQNDITYSAGTHSISFPTEVDNSLGLVMDPIGHSKITSLEDAIWVISYQVTVISSLGPKFFQIWIENSSDTSVRHGCETIPSLPDTLHKFSNTVQLKVAKSDEISVKFYCSGNVKIGDSPHTDRYGSLVITRLPI